MTIKSPKTAIALLCFISFIWGFGFVLVDISIETVPTHSFNGLRFLIATLCLLPLWKFDRPSSIDSTADLTKQYSLSRLFITGFGLGFLLFLGFATQTEGMRYTSVSNAGFITGLSVPLVPLLGFLLFRDKLSISAWFGVASATAGLYFLTIGDKLVFNSGDLLILICALSFASHIIATGKTTHALPSIPLSIIQMAAVTLYSFLSALLNGELSSTADVQQLAINLMEPIVIVTIVIAATLGSALAYWAQTAAQKIISPYKVALIFALEPLFAHASAAIFLGETLGIKGWVGAGLIISGMLIAQLGDKNHPPQMHADEHSSTPKGY